MKRSRLGEAMERHGAVEGERHGAMRPWGGKEGQRWRDDKV